MSDDTELITCDKHGPTPTTFACQHLTFGVACGYHASGDDPNDPWPDAWCDLCHEAFEAAGQQWNQQSERDAHIKVMCTHCYDAARERNLNPPPLARGAAARLSDNEVAALLHHAVHEMQALQDASDAEWGWRAYDRWDFDEDAQTLTFSNPDGAQLIATVSLIGSYSTKSHTFQWAWQAFSEGARQTRAIARLRVFGEVRGIHKLTAAKWACDEDEGWQMAAIAGYILGADGLYRAPMEHTHWFMRLSRWRHPS